jgi:hypothetical protein
LHLEREKVKSLKDTLTTLLKVVIYSPKRFGQSHNAYGSICDAIVKRFIYHSKVAIFNLYGVFRVF